MSLKIALLMLGIFVASVVFIIGLMIYAAAWSRAMQLMILKKYTAKQAFVYAALVFGGGVGAIAAPLLLIDKINWFSYFFYAGALFLLMPLILFIWVDILPKSNRQRQFGDRKADVNWQFIGYISIAIGIFFSILFVVVAPDTFKTALKVATKFVPGMIAVYAIFRHYKNLYKKKNIETQTAEDRRPPVLFIRSFLQDEDVFFFGNIYANQLPEQVSPDLLQYKQSGFWGSLNFTQFFARAFDEQIGPLIGLGDPNNYMPLDGLTTSYYADQNWQQMFRQWVHRAGCIVNLPGGTAGLRFELQYILENGLTDRFFIFTQPATKYFYQKPMLRLLRWQRVVEPVRWRDFAEGMNSFGYAVQLDEPPPGTVIGFTKKGVQKLLVSGATNPMGYVSAVISALPR